MIPANVWGGLNHCFAARRSNRTVGQPTVFSISPVGYCIQLLLLLLVCTTNTNASTDTSGQHISVTSSTSTTPTTSHGRNDAGPSADPAMASSHWPLRSSLVRHRRNASASSHNQHKPAATRATTGAAPVTAMTTTTGVAEVAHRWWVDRRLPAPRITDSSVSQAKLLEFIGRHNISRMEHHPVAVSPAAEQAITPNAKHRNAAANDEATGADALNALFTTTESAFPLLAGLSDATSATFGGSISAPVPVIFRNSSVRRADIGDNIVMAKSDGADEYRDQAGQLKPAAEADVDGPVMGGHPLSNQQQQRVQLQLQQHVENGSRAATRSQLQYIAQRDAIKSSSPTSALGLVAVSSSSTSVSSSATVIAVATNSLAAMKGHKTDAPMLNYIFDSHLATNKHIHHDRNGPQFEDAARLGNGGELNVTVQIGTPAYLNCRINLLQDKTVSWVKREPANDRLDLLTVGKQTYTGDTRFSVEFQYPNNWRLRIADANKSDEGVYECQISTYPPRVIKTFLCVRSPEVCIADEHGAMLVDKFYEVDSTIQLVCIVRHIAMTTSVVYWLHGDRMLNFDMSRGGISVRTDLMDNGANSTLSIAKIGKQDSGNYTCSIGPNDFYTMTLHVLNGESLAELYHGSTAAAIHTNQAGIIIRLMVAIPPFAAGLTGLAGRLQRFLSLHQQCRNARA